MWRKTPIKYSQLNELLDFFQSKYYTSLTFALVLHLCIYISWFFITLHLAIVSDPGIKWYWILQVVFMGVSCIAGAVHLVVIIVGLHKFLAVLRLIIEDRTGQSLDMPAAGGDRKPDSPQALDYGVGAALLEPARLGSYETAIFEMLFPKGETSFTTSYRLPYLTPFVERVIADTQSFHKIEEAWPRPPALTVLLFVWQNIWLAFYPMVGAWVDWILVLLAKFLEMCRRSGRSKEYLPQHIQDAVSDIPLPSHQSDSQQYTPEHHGDTN